jgi:hypothetical protein
MKNDYKYNWDERPSTYFTAGERPWQSLGPNPRLMIGLTKIH